MSRVTDLLFLSPRIFKRQKTLVESTGLLQNLQCLKCSTSVRTSEVELKTNPEKKLLKVAIVGRPNAGKSTLINGILKLNVCGVSHKSHTTKKTFRAAFTQGDTQIVFVDTPGLVTKKELVRFNLSDDFIEWKKRVVNEADIIGIVHEATEPRSINKFHLNLIQNIQDFPESKPLFLVFNKLDLVLDKDALSLAVDSLLRPQNLEQTESKNKSKIFTKFSKIFFISALKNKGVSEIVDYLLGQAKPGEWLFEPGQVFTEPLHLLINNLIRSSLLDILPNEIPYQCKYEIEYLKENEIGEIICVSLVTCKNNRQLHLITSGKKGSLREICKRIESDLYKILGRVVKLRLVVQTK